MAQYSVAGYVVELRKKLGRVGMELFIKPQIRKETQLQPRTLINIQIVEQR